MIAEQYIQFLGAVFLPVFFTCFIMYSVTGYLKRRRHVRSKSYAEMCEVLKNTPKAVEPKCSDGARLAKQDVLISKLERKLAKLEKQTKARAAKKKYIPEIRESNDLWRNRDERIAKEKAAKKKAAKKKPAKKKQHIPGLSQQMYPVKKPVKKKKTKRKSKK